MKNKEFLLVNGVNLEKSLELFGDIQTYNSSLNDFLDDVDEKLTKLQEYKEVADMRNYSIQVHALKSDAKYFGFDTLADLAYQHEVESKVNNIYFVYENYEKLIDEAVKIVDLVKEYLGKTDIQSKFERTEAVVIKNDTILVVDDSTVIRNFIQNVFHNQYQVLIAHDGQEAINIISTSDKSKIVAMLLDLNMPNVNGFQVLDYFRINNLFSEIPVSVVTGIDSNDILNQAFQYPIIDVLRKPFNEKSVKEVLDHTITAGLEIL